MEKVFTGLLACIVVFGLYLSANLYNNLNSLRERVNRQNMEYQIVISEDSVGVFDRERFVGSVKLQGQLDSLLIEDNQ